MHFSKHTPSHTLSAIAITKQTIKNPYYIYNMFANIKSMQSCKRPHEWKDKT